MGKIYLKNIRLYAYHGCMDEEKKIGKCIWLKMSRANNGNLPVTAGTGQLSPVPIPSRDLVHVEYRINP